MNLMKAQSDNPKGRRDDEILVFWVVRLTQCSECGEELDKGRLLRLEKEKALCIKCADLDHLEFLPSGDTAVTRRASKYSKLRAVVVRWSRTRKRYERQGILAEPGAIARAEEESLADAEVRARRQARDAERRAVEDEEYVAAFAQAIRVQFPGCPPGEENEIAQHACRKYSDRVGRTAAAKQFDPKAVHLAVIAHVRHVHTNYDERLGEFGDRESARASVQYQVSAILDDWQSPAP
jgi:hypothetical protein